MIELMVTLLLIAVLASIAVPLFRNLMLSNRLTSSTNEIVLAAHTARMEAIKRTQRIRISALDSSSDDNEWGPGMVVYLDNDASGTFDAGDEQIRTVPGVRGRNTINGPDGVASFDFLPSGGTSIGAITLQLCDERVAETGRSVTVTRNGQVSASELSCG